MKLWCRDVGLEKEHETSHDVRQDRRMQGDVALPTGPTQPPSCMFHKQQFWHVG